MRPYDQPSRLSAPPVGSSRQAGSSLLEVLVSILIVSFGILGLLGLLAKASSLSVAAEDRTRAALLANDVVSAVQMLRSVELPNDVLDQFEARVANPQRGGLPDGKLTIAKVANTRLATITIDWLPTSATGESEEHRARHTTLAALP